MIFTYVCTYFIVTVLCAAVGLVTLNHLTFDMGSEQEISSFRVFILSYMVFCLTNSIWVWINYGYLDIDGDINSTINLISICLCSYFWFYFITVRTNPKRVEEMSFRAISILPLIISCTIIFTTPYTKLVFYYTKDNEYIHGPLYSVMVLLAFFYLIIASIQLYVNAKRTHSGTLRRDYKILAQFLAYPLVAGVIDVFIPNLPIMELSMMVGMVIIFTNLQSARIYTDMLTGLNNRRRAEAHISELMEYASEENPLYFFFGDINRFKDINDKYGHIEGDKALKYVAGMLRVIASEQNCQAARWGGDEFVMIGEGEIKDGPEVLIDQINEGLSKLTSDEELPYELKMSIGYTKCTAYKAPDALYKKADQMMYKKKIGMK